MQRRKVHLPEPEAPIIDTTSPSRAVSETPFRTSSVAESLVKIVDPDSDRTVRHLSSLQLQPRVSPRLAV